MQRPFGTALLLTITCHLSIMLAQLEALLIGCSGYLNLTRAWTEELSWASFSQFGGISGRNVTGEYSITKNALFHSFQLCLMMTEPCSRWLMSLM
jgi:hypothetical protein